MLPCLRMLSRDADSQNQGMAQLSPILSYGTALYKRRMQADACRSVLQLATLYYTNRVFAKDCFMFEAPSSTLTEAIEGTGVGCVCYHVFRTAGHDLLCCTTTP